MRTIVAEAYARRLNVQCSLVVEMSVFPSSKFQLSKILSAGFVEMAGPLENRDWKALNRVTSHHGNERKGAVYTAHPPGYLTSRLTLDDLAFSPYSCMLAHMKTTLELPDALLQKAKGIALRRQTTLRALITHALEREVEHSEIPAASCFAVDEDGIPHLPSRGMSVSSQTVHRLLEEESIPYSLSAEQRRFFSSEAVAAKTSVVR